MTKVVEDNFVRCGSALKEGIRELAGDIADRASDAEEVRLRDPRFRDVLVARRLVVEAAEFAALAGIFGAVEGRGELAERVWELYFGDVRKVLVVCGPDSDRWVALYGAVPPEYEYE